MKYRFITLTILILGAFSIISPAQNEPGAVSPIVFINANVVDVKTGSILKGRTVVVRNGKIASMEPSGQTEIPSDAQVVEAEGKYLIPGLWDMHTHVNYDDKLTRDVYLPLFVAHGITGIREMSAQPSMLKLRDDIAKGTILGPTIVAGALVDGPNPWPSDEPQLTVANAVEARKMVDSLKSQGFDFVKPYQFLSADSYRALLSQSNKVGLEAAGEIPMSISLWEAAASGQRSVEHLTGVAIACSRNEEELRVKYRKEVEAISANKTLTNHVLVWNRTEWEAIPSIDNDKCNALYRHLKAQGTWVVPTLETQRQISNRTDPSILNDPRAKYLPSEDWNPRGTAEFFDPKGRLRPTYEYRIKSLVNLKKAGVGILAGTDMFGGFPLHDELKLYADNGLTPLEALQTATMNPAIYFGAFDSRGSVEPGKDADLVLLDADPLENIANIRRIAAVVLRGHMLNREALNKMLAKAEATSKKRI